MNSSDNWLSHDHAEQEKHLARCQDAVAVEDWDQAAASFQELFAELKWHITQEEQVVYPAYEAQANVPAEPTTTLRAEHRKIMDFMNDTRRVFASRDSGHVLDCLERLEQLLIKHHEKEEDIFLPMASLILTDNRKAILEKLMSFKEPRSG